jgi:hypothetical protein
MLLARVLGAAVVAALCACGARSARPAPDDSGAPSDAGRDGANDGPLDASGVTDSAADAPSDSTNADGSPLDAGGGPHACHVGRDCLAWWPNGEAFCDFGVCCNGRIDRFGCVCGELRGGCPAGDIWCCDDLLEPEIPVGCSDRPCD